MSLNMVQLIGHLGADPEVRRSQAGNPIVTFRLATSDTWKDKTTGERKEATQWHQVVVFNENLGKVAEQYCKKGSKVYVQGKLKTRKWTDQSGADRYSTEVVLEQFGGGIELLDRREGRPPPDENSYGPTRTSGAASGGGRAAAQDAPIDDDIPF